VGNLGTKYFSVCNIDGKKEKRRREKRGKRRGREIIYACATWIVVSPKKMTVR